MTDLLAGTMHMTIEVMPSALPQVQGEKLRGLGVTTANRWPLAADIPTMNEAGMKDFVVTAWDGLFAPAGTPKPVIDALNAAVRKALADPQLTETLLKRGAEPVPGTPEEFSKHVDAEVARWGKLVKESRRGDQLRSARPISAAHPRNPVGPRSARRGHCAWWPVCCGCGRRTGVLRP